MNKKGFTLIELLIVVLIIGILSGITLSVLNSSGVKQKAQDSQRIADLKRVQSALELYFADHRSYPPFVKSSLYGSGIDVLSSISSDLINGGYISALPVDPRGSLSSVDVCNESVEHGYLYGSDVNRDVSGNFYATKYLLIARMGVPTSANSSTCESISNWSFFAGCNAPAGCYAIQNP